MTMSLAHGEGGALSTNAPRSATVSRDTASAATFVTLLTAIYSFGSVFKYLPGIGWVVTYATITLIFLLIYATIGLNNTRHAVNKTDFGIFLIIGAFLPYSIWFGNSLADIAGDYIRMCILIGAMIYWTGRRVDEALFFSILSRNLFILAVTFMTLKEVGQFALFNRQINIDVPVLILLFCLLFWRREWVKLGLAVIMIIMTGKEAGILAVLSVLGVHYFFRNALGAIFVMLVCALIIYNIGAVFDLFEQSSIGKLARLGQVGNLMVDGDYNEKLLNHVTTNRWSEYQSLFNVWRAEGMPILGYGLGHVVDVFLFHKGEIAQRSTFHNSIVILYHKLGILGVFLIFYYFLSMLFQQSRSKLYTYMAVAFLTYCLFNYSLLQAPSIVMIFGLFHRAIPVGRMA